MGFKFGFLAAGLCCLTLDGCAAVRPVPAPSSKSRTYAAARPIPAAATSSARATPSAAVASSAPPDEPAASSASSAAPTTPTESRIASTDPTLQQRLQALRGAGFVLLADIVAERVSQKRRKMKVTEDEAKLVAQELIEELPSLPRTRELLVLMPKASIELVRSTRERGVARAEAERIASYLLEVRSQLAMDNPGPFDENCSHVVGREWQDIDYRDEGMTWQRQQSIYGPKGVPNFKTAASIRQFFRVESKAPYFQKLYQVKGSVL